MKIKAAIMKNFRQFKDELIIFPQYGILGIVGKNGRGKTTILNVISWAFYAKFHDMVKEDIKHDKAGSREECYVILFFEFKGIDYVLKRHLTKRDECFLQPLHGGTPLVPSGYANLTNYITNIFFKMDYKTFTSCFYAQQKDFDALAKLSPAQKRETLTSLLRINDIDKAIKRVKDMIKEKEEEIEKKEPIVKKEGMLLERIAQSKENIQYTNQQINILQQELTQIEDLYKDLLVKRAEGEADYQTFQRLKNTYKEELRELKILEERVLKADIQRVDSLRQKQERFTEIQENIELYSSLLQESEQLAEQRNLFQEKQSLISQLKGIQSELEICKKEYAVLQDETKDVSSLQKEIQSLQDKKQEVFTSLQHTITLKQEKQFEIRSVENELKRLNETRNKFGSLGKDSPCPTCERPLGEHFDETMSHLQEESIPYEQKKIELQKALVELESKEKEYKLLHDQYSAEERRLVSVLNAKERKQERLTFIEQQVRGLNQKHESIMPRYQEVKHIAFDEKSYQSLATRIRQTKQLHDEALSIQSSIQDIPMLEERIKASQKEVERINETLTSIQQEVEALGFDEASYKSLTTQIEQTQESAHSLKDAITKHSYQIKHDEQLITFSQNELLEISGAKKEIASCQKRISFLLKLGEGYKYFKIDIIAQMAPELSEIMSEDLQRITQGYYDEVEVDRNFNIFVYRLGERKPLSFFSGGEQNLFALIQLLSVSHLLTNQTGQAGFEVIVMDEVLSSFDDDRQANTIEQLRNLSEVFPQVIMVAHQQLVKDMFDYTLEVTVNDKRESSAKWIQSWDDSEIREMVESYLQAS